MTAAARAAAVARRLMAARLTPAKLSAQLAAAKAADVTAVSRQVRTMLGHIILQLVDP